MNAVPNPNSGSNTRVADDVKPKTTTSASEAAILISGATLIAAII